MYFGRRHVDCGLVFVRLMHACHSEGLRCSWPTDREPWSVAVGCDIAGEPSLRHSDPDEPGLCRAANRSRLMPHDQNPPSELHRCPRQPRALSGSDEVPVRLVRADAELVFPPAIASEDRIASRWFHSGWGFGTRQSNLFLKASALEIEVSSIGRTAFPHTEVTNGRRAVLPFDSASVIAPTLCGAWQVPARRSHGQAAL